MLPIIIKEANLPASKSADDKKIIQDNCSTGELLNAIANIIRTSSIDELYGIMNTIYGVLTERGEAALDDNAPDWSLKGFEKQFGKWFFTTQLEEE